MTLRLNGLAMRADTMHIVEPRAQARLRSPQTTDALRILGDLMDDLDDRIKSVQEVAAAYGHQAPGAGRRRRFPAFEDYLKECIRYAESTAAEVELRGLLCRAGKHGAAAARSADTRRVNTLLAHTGSARAEELRGWLAEIEDRTAL